MSTIQGDRSDDFVTVMHALDEATQRFVDRDPSALKALFSHRDDVTIAGGLGGIDIGWHAVGPRLDRVSAQYEPARFSAERVAVHRDGDLAVVVQRERFHWTATSDRGPAAKEYRATIVLRQEDGAWRVVHRHADGLAEDRSTQ